MQNLSAQTRWLSVERGVPKAGALLGRVKAVLLVLFLGIYDKSVQCRRRRDSMVQVVF